LGALWQTAYDARTIDEFLKKESRITLRVVSIPRQAKGKNSFTAGVKTIDDYPVEARLKVADHTKDLSYLNLYQLKGRITKRCYRGYWFYSLAVKKDADIKELPLGFWGKLAKNSSVYLLKLFRENCSQPTGRFLSAVFLGRKELLGEERESFSNAGVSHLLAISGLHLGLTSLILFFVLRFFNVKFRASLVISLVFLYFYTFLTGAGSSTLRAAVMYSVFALGFLFRRKTNLLNSLGLAGLVVLILNPHALFTIGFQLSFVSVFAIILGFKIFSPALVRIAAWNYFLQILLCSFYVSLFLTPLVSYYFGKIHILSIFYNLILIPLFTFILAVNFLMIIFSPFNFPAQSLGAVLSLVTAFFIRLVEFLGSVKFSFVSYTFSPAGILVYYLCLTGALIFWGRFSNLRARRKIENRSLSH
jgi:competence protein ComEC